MGRTACTEPQCLYRTTIPLLPLWAVRPVQSLSAGKVELYLYFPYGPYGLYRASVPEQGCSKNFRLCFIKIYKFVSLWAPTSILAKWHGRLFPPILNTELSPLNSEVKNEWKNSSTAA